MSKISSRGAMEVLVRCVLPVGFAAALSIIMLAPASAASTGVSHKAVAASAVAAPVDLALPAALPYRDCTGATPLGHTSIYHDTCAHGIYLVGHNPGPFTVLLSLRVGSRVSFEGRAYTIRSVDARTPAAQWAEAAAHPAVLTLQTCVNDAAGDVWVFTAS